MTSETDSILGANYYTLQDDSQFFATTTTYTAGLPATGWEQFIYLNYPSANTGYAYIQYWLLNFESEYGGCPSTSPPGGSIWIVFSGSCYANGPAALVPLESASNLGSLVLSGYANFNSNDESYLCINGGSCFGVGVTSQVLDLYQNWVDSEFNIFGAGSGSQANFNPGTTLWVSNVLSSNVVASCTTNGYTGETNNLNIGSCYTWNNDAATFIESNLAIPTLTTSLSPPAIVIGGSLHDTATMTGETGTAGGTVTYYWYSTLGTCLDPGPSPYTTDTVSVTDGVVPNSQTYGPLGAGAYSWQAVYSGDVTNAPAVSPCESLTVSSPPLSIGTTLSSGSIVAGSSVTDMANIAGGVGPTGTVTFFWSTTDICPAAGATQVGGPVGVAGDGSYPSISQTFTSEGQFYWYAVYSGDANNPTATSACEALNVVSSSSVTVQVRLTSAEQGAAQDAFAVSGCNASVASVPGDGGDHSFRADPSCPMTLTAAQGPGGSTTAANFPFTVSPPTPSVWGDNGIIVSAQPGGSGAALSQSGTQDCWSSSGCELILLGPVKVGD
ncbi:MAG TPA: Ig-like domain-containing protein, partial [Nitrososphaerales archaeon]|nr:Ig-like domain-containing protein [Nitrososphaerales archaeon]